MVSNTGSLEAILAFSLEEPRADQRRPLAEARGSSRSFARDSVYRFVEPMEKAGAVPFVERPRSTYDLTEVAQRGEKVASCQRRSNVIFGKWVARRA